MKIRRIALAAEELRKLSGDELNLLLLVGHINNEVSSLTKLFGWCSAAAVAKDVSAIEANAANAQAMIYSRMLAGKLLEAWASLEKSWFASKLGAEVGKSLHPEAINSLVALKKYFRGKNLIAGVRNSFAFHYSAKALGEHWELASKEPFFEIVIGINRGNTFSQASELAANVAVFQTAAPDDAHAGMARFFNEVNEISGHFQNFCEGVTRAVLERLSGLNLDQLGGLDEIAPSRKFSEVVIPVFCLPDEDVGQILP